MDYNVRYIELNNNYGPVFPCMNLLGLKLAKNWSPRIRHHCDDGMMDARESRKIARLEENMEEEYIPNAAYTYWKMKIDMGYYLTTKYIAGKFECHGCLAKLSLNATLQENYLFLVAIRQDLCEFSIRFQTLKTIFNPFPSALCLI